MRAAAFPSFGGSEGPSGPSLVCDLLGEQSERKQAPGELGVRAQEVERVRHAGQTVSLASEPVEGGGELGARAWRVQVGGQRADSWAIGLQRAMRVSTGREHEESAPPAGAQGLRVELHLLGRDEREPGEQALLTGVVRTRLEVLEQRTGIGQRPSG